MSTPHHGPHARRPSATRSRAPPRRRRGARVAAPLGAGVGGAGQAVPLTATEFELLRILSLNGGRVVTTEALPRLVAAGSDTDHMHTAAKKLRAFACELAGKAWDLAGARFTFTIPVAGEAGGRCGDEPGGGGQRARVLPPAKPPRSRFPASPQGNSRARLLLARTSGLFGQPDTQDAHRLLAAETGT